MTMAPQHPVVPAGERSDPWHRHPHPHAGRRATGRPADSAAATGSPPALATDVTLLGEYEGSGYTTPHFLARKANGAVVQLSELLYLVADACDGQRSTAQIAAQVSERYGKTVTADNVETLLAKLRPLGVVTAADGTSPQTAPLDPLLALRWRTPLVGSAAVRAVTLPFRPLFLPPVVAAVVAGLIAFDGWLFFVHGLAQGVRVTMQEPVTFLLVAVLVIVSAAFHEIGHATACVYSGGRPGRMGAGVYLAWPAFYTDVTDAYRLPRAGRLRTDLGGVYFNAVFVLGLAAGWWLTGFEPLLLVAFLLQIEVVHQMLPFLRLDGYYVLSDIVGVPDLFRRIGPVLSSLLPGRRAGPEVRQLKRWVRWLVTGWVLCVVPLLLANLLLVVLSLPRVLATAWDSAARLVGQLLVAAPLLKAADALQLLFLAVPLAGLVLTMVQLGYRAARGGWRWSAGSPGRRTLVLLAGGAAVALLAAAWWPDGRVAPYRPGERGTLVQGVQNLQQAGTGSPQLDPIPAYAGAPVRTTGQVSPSPAVSGGPRPAATGSPSGGAAPAPAAGQPAPARPGVSAPPGGTTPQSTASPTATASPSPPGPSSSPSPSSTP